MTNEHVLKVVERGPRQVAQTEASWYIDQADGQIVLSGPARRAFELGVALATSPARLDFRKTDGFADAKEAERGGRTAYATSGPLTKPQVPSTRPKKSPAASTANADEATPAEIRAWARAHSYVVEDRGRISEQIRVAYAAAQRSKAEKAAQRAAPRPKKAPVDQVAALRAARKKFPKKSRTNAPADPEFMDVEAAGPRQRRLVGETAY